MNHFPQKKILCITGNIGSGKSTTLEIFREFGAEIINSDAIVSGLLESDSGIQKQLVSCLGQQILANGKIDKKKVAEIVFADTSRLTQLNSIIHPEVFKTASKIIECSSAKLVAWEIPLLFETGMQNKCNYTLTVVANNPVAQMRLQKNRNFSTAEFLARKSKQMDPEQQKSLSDFVIYNDNSIEELRNSCKKVYTAIIKNTKDLQ